MGAGDDVLRPNSKTPARKTGKSRPDPKAQGRAAEPLGQQTLIQCQEKTLLHTQESHLEPAGHSAQVELLLLKESYKVQKSLELNSPPGTPHHSMQNKEPSSNYENRFDLMDSARALGTLQGLLDCTLRTTAINK